MSEIYELPSGWAKPRLSDIAKINPKLPFEIENQDIEVSFLPMRLVEALSNKIHLTEQKKYSEVKKGFTPMVDEDVIFAKITPCMENGKIAIVHSLKNSIGFGSTEFHVFRTNAACSNKYLFYWLVQDQTRSIAAKNMRGAVGQRRVPKEFLEEYHIHLPPVNEQHSIVSKIEELFSSLDKGVESLRTAQQQLKVYRQAVLKWAFEGKLTNENVKDGELPEGWKISTLGVLKEFSLYGPRFSSSDYTDDGVAILRTSDISANGKVYWENAPKLKLSDKDYEKYKLIKDDLLITRTGSIGTISVFNDDKRAIAGAFLIYYRLKKTVDVWYVFNFLRTFEAQRHLKSHSSGVGRPNLNVPNIETLNIPLPSFVQQHDVVSEIESRLSICDKIEESIEQSLQQAEALRQSILKKAFEGKLVPQDSNDEPASVLLERIRVENEKIASSKKDKKAKKSHQTELVFETI